MTTDASGHGATPSRPLLIGVGNRDRGDDGVGPLVVQAFAEQWPDRVDVLLAEGDLSDLALRWRSDQFVIIVDAVVSGRPAGTISEMDGLGKDLSSNGRLISSHGVGITEAIALAKLLDRRPAGITIVGVEAAQCDHFAELSTPVAEATSVLLQKICDLIESSESRAEDREQPARAGERPSCLVSAVDEAQPRA